MTVTLTGHLICTTEAEAAIVHAHLPAHVAASRAEPGCMRFNVTPETPLTWAIDEEYTDAEALAAHRARGAASEWGRVTAGIRREIVER